MIKDRIIHLLEVKREKKEKTFANLGVTSANFRGRAKETPVNSDVIANLFAMFPDLNLEWLITGEGPMLKGDCQPNMVTLDRYTELVRENERLRVEIQRVSTNHKHKKRVLNH